MVVAHRAGRDSADTSAVAIVTPPMGHPSGGARGDVDMMSVPPNASS